MKTIIKILCVLTLVFGLSSCGYERIDAGGTFLGELKVLKERYPDSEFEIIVCHAVNIEGLVKLCNNFDRVMITNSYCDYGYKPSNNNLTVIDVCGQ